MRHLLTFNLALILVLCALPASAASTAKVSYLTSSTVYIDAGSSQGIAVGDSIEVWRDGHRLGTLVVDYTSQTRSTCSLKDAAFQPRVGDEIRFVPGEVHTAAAPVLREEEAGEGPEQAQWRGRVGMSFLGVRTREDFGQNFDQPAGDLRIHGRHLAQDHLAVEVDARARHTYRRPTEGAKSDQALNRVYRASLRYSQPGSSSDIVLGRQSSPELWNLSIFDGVSATLRHEKWSAGLTGGVQPTFGDLDFSTDVTEVGAFYRRQTPRNRKQRWNLTLATIASYHKSEIDREYLYLQGTWSDPQWSLFASQELDLNRGWKRNFDSSVFSPTATYLYARYRVRRELRLKAGFDNRRRVRLWTDRETPETLFDESYRRGYWLGADSRLGRAWNMGLDFRGSSGGAAGSASVISIRANYFDLRRLPVEIGGRLSRFGNDRYDGILASMNLGWEISSVLRLDGEGGIRNENHDGFVQDQTDQHWFGLRTELALQAGWYLNLSGEWTRGGIDTSDLYYSSLNYRF
jgi:hypothetical protein